MDIAKIVSKSRISLETSEPTIHIPIYIYIYIASYIATYMDNIYEVFLFLDLDICIIKKGNSHCF